MISYKSPEEAGFSRTQINAFYEILDKKNIPLHSMILYQGDAILEKRFFSPVRENSLHRMFSIAKTITALAIGLLMKEQKVKLSDCIVNFFPDKLPPNPDSRLLEMTIEDMLRMRTCHSKSTYNKFDLQSDWVESFFTTKPDHKSGTVFFYDTSAAHVLAALVERLTGQKLLDYFRSQCPQLEISRNAYMICDGQGISMGGSGLMATSMDLLKIGILLLNNGAYAGKQLIPEEFIESAGSFLTPTLMNASIPAEACGYGYMIWQTERQGLFCYGMGGQFILVHPKEKMIFITTADTQGYAGGNQIIFDAFYSCIYAPYIKKESIQPHLSFFKPKSRLKLASETCLTPSLRKESYPIMQDTTYLLSENANAYTTLSLMLDKNGGRICFEGEKPAALCFGYEEFIQNTFPSLQVNAYGSGIWMTDQYLYVKFHLLGESVGSIHFEFYFHNHEITLQMRKIEETFFQEFQGLLHGIRIS